MCILNFIWTVVNKAFPCMQQPGILPRHGKKRRESTEAQFYLSFGNPSILFCSHSKVISWWVVHITHTQWRRLAKFLLKHEWRRWPQDLRCIIGVTLCIWGTQCQETVLPSPFLSSGFLSWHNLHRKIHITSHNLHFWTCCCLPNMKSTPE